MKKFAGILAFVLIFGGVIYRLFFWGMDVAEFVETEQRNDRISISNRIVDEVNSATESVEVMHDLMIQSSDSTSENHRGAVLLLELGQDQLPDSIEEIRGSLDGIETDDDADVQELIDAARRLLDVYESFVPMHAALSQKILLSEDYPPELMEEVYISLADIETDMSAAIEDFSQVQYAFID